MNCPRCRTIILSERDRDGLLVDVCAGCRGVWLDRGELEKLISSATRELDELGRERDDTPPRGISYDDDRRYPTKKRRWIDALKEIFD